MPSSFASDLGLLPQAVIRRPINFFEGLGYRFEAGSDDLDAYEWALFELDEKLRFALVHYKGNPVRTTDLYFADMADRGSVLRRCLSAFDLPPIAATLIDREEASSPDADTSLPSPQIASSR